MWVLQIPPRIQPRETPPGRHTLCIWRVRAIFSTCGCERLLTSERFGKVQENWLIPSQSQQVLGRANVISFYVLLKIKCLKILYYELSSLISAVQDQQVSFFKVGSKL